MLWESLWRNINDDVVRKNIQYYEDSGVRIAPVHYAWMRIANIKVFTRPQKKKWGKYFQITDVLPWFGGLDVDNNVIQIRDLMRGWEGVRGEERRGSHSNSDGSWSYWFLMLKTWVLRLWGGWGCKLVYLSFEENLMLNCIKTV